MYGTTNGRARVSASNKTSGEISADGGCPIRGCNFKLDQQLTTESKREHLLSVEHARQATSLAVQIARSNIAENERSLTDDSDSHSDEIVPAIEEFQGTTDRLNQSSILKDQLNARLPSMSDHIEETSKQSRVQQKIIEAISINESVLWHEARCVSRRAQECGFIRGHTPADGTTVWRIDGVNEKFLDAQSERTTSIYSPPFLTSPSGYRVCARLYLNGDGTARGTHLSLFLVILRGPYDNILTWPFSFRVAFCLVDQRALQEPNSGAAKDVIDCFRPNVQSVSFQQPKTGMNIASGIPKFMPLADLEQPMDRNRYRLDDTIFIKIYIDFRDLPKEMIPFIFSLDAGLPTHVREKIIIEERQRIEAKQARTPTLNPMPTA